MYIPQLPRNYTKRIDEQDEVINALIQYDHTTNVTALTAALRGAGGFGKSTIANAVCNDDRIKRSFPDGIYWVDLGEKVTESLLAEKINHLLEDLGVPNPNYTDYKDASKKLREKLVNLRILIVIDDVWNRGHLEQFLQGGPQCAHLVTTRDSSTLPTETKIVYVDSASPEQALQMLRIGLPEGENELLLKLSGKLLYWPLLLGLANGQLNKDISQNHATLQTAIERALNLYESRGIIAFDLKNPIERNQAAKFALDVSLDQLTPEERRNLIKLAVFPENTIIPLTAVRALWGRTASLKYPAVESLCGQFTSLSFIQQYDAEEKSFRIHAVIHEYLSELLDSESGEPYRTHQDLIEGYLDEFNIISKQWWLVPDDRYYFQHLLSHLLAAKQLYTATNLFFNYKWLKKVISIAGILSIIRDCELIMNTIGTTKNLDNSELYLMRDFFRLSAHVLGQDYQQFPSQIVGRLSDFLDIHIDQLVQQARQERDFNWLSPFYPYLTQPGGSELMTFEGHSSPISFISISNDEHRLVSGSDDGTLKVWDLDNGECLFTFKDHSSKINGIVIISNSEIAISASSAGILKIWDIKRGSCLGTQELTQKGIKSITVTPDEETVIVVTNDGNILAWRWRSQTELPMLEQATLKPGIKVLVANNKDIIFVSTDEHTKKWDIDNGALITLHKHKTPIIGHAISDDRKRAISISNDHTFIFWDVETGKLLQTFNQRIKKNIKVIDVVLSSNGKLAVCVTDDNKLRAWDTALGKLVKVLRGHGHNIQAIAITKNEKTNDEYWLISASSDRTLKVWNIASGECGAILNGHSDKVNNLLISGDGKRAISGSRDKTIKIWNLETVYNHQDKGKSKNNDYITHKHDSPLNEIIIDELGSLVISASQDNTCKIWEIKSGNCLHTLKKHEKPINALALTTSGKNIVTGSGDGTVILWNIENGNLLKTLVKGDNILGITSVIANDDGTLIAAGSKDSNIYIHYDGLNFLLRGHKSNTDLERQSHSNPQVQGITALTLIPQSNRIISAASDCAIKVWDISSRRCLRTMREHSRFVSSIVITPDGRRAISASYDAHLKIWDIESGKCLGTLRGHGGPVRMVKTTSDGQYAISASSDCTIRVWDLSNYTCKHILKGHTDRVNSLTLHHNGCWVASAAKDMTIRIWDYQSGECLVTFRGDAPFYTVGFDNSSLPTRVIAGDHQGNTMFLTFVMSKTPVSIAS